MYIYIKKKKRTKNVISQLTVTNISFVYIFKKINKYTHTHKKKTQSINNFISSYQQSDNNPIHSKMRTHNVRVCLFLTWMFTMLQLASDGLPHRWQPCQPDVYSLKYAQITQVHERTSPIQSSHFTAICHRLQELFPSCVHELKDS